MLKLSDIMRLDVYAPKGSDGVARDQIASVDLRLVGKVHQAVFYPDGRTVAGLLLMRPDIGGMIRREDVFVTLDSVAYDDRGLVAWRGEASFDDAARERLGLDWDACIIWCGMDAKTDTGKELGWVSDIEFSPKSGRVKAFLVDDGSVAKSLVGSVAIPPELLVGYKDGFMVVKDEASSLSLTGGLAAQAGEGYAKAKEQGRKVAESAAEATYAGARGVGRAIGKAKRSYKKTKGKDASKLIGEHAKGARTMFSSCMDEYRKASK